MKRLMYMLSALCLSSLFAGELEAYIARYDKPLAIEIYRQKLNDEESREESCRALARLYEESGRNAAADTCYRALLSWHPGDTEIRRNYIGFLYGSGDYVRLRSVLKETPFDPEWSQSYRARSYFREGLFDSSFALGTELAHLDDGKLMRLSREGLDLSLRSPVLGGLMSAVIPGSGKVYAGRWMDGLQAFSMIAAPAYNAYYHFSKNGAGSVRGWIWAAVGAWFYLSDIYGSVKAVNDYNAMQKNKVILKLVE